MTVGDTVESLGTGTLSGALYNSHSGHHPSPVVLLLPITFYVQLLDHCIVPETLTCFAKVIGNFVISEVVPVALFQLFLNDTSAPQADVFECFFLSPIS